MLRASDAIRAEAFGWAVAMSDDAAFILVGSLRDDVGSTMSAGSARVFARAGTTWTEQATLLAPGELLLGTSVALSADASVALVGSQESASVFVRSRTTWSLAADLAAPEPASGDQFGWAVALSSDGGRALVGAPVDDTSAGVETGAAYVFSRSGTDWALEASLLPSDLAPSDRFGASVALSADGARAMVGAWLDGGAGTVRTFSRTGGVWTEEAVLSGGARLFGVSVAASADGLRVVSGADSTAIVHTRGATGWVETRRLVAPAMSFGHPVAASRDGSWALVGAAADGGRGSVWAFPL